MQSAGGRDSPSGLKLRTAGKLARVLAYGRQGVGAAHGQTHCPVEDRKREDYYHSEVDPVRQQIRYARTVTSQEPDEDLTCQPWTDPDGVANRVCRAGLISPSAESK